jgi:hypothetical protein
MAAQAKPPITGMLHKKGRTKGLSWKERFFSLDGDTLRYFLKASDGESRGEVHARGVFDVPNRHGDLRSNRLDVVCTSIDDDDGKKEAILCLAAASPEEKQRWVAALTEATHLVELKDHPRFDDFQSKAPEPAPEYMVPAKPPFVPPKDLPANKAPQEELLQLERELLIITWKREHEGGSFEQFMGEHYPEEAADDAVDLRGTFEVSPEDAPGDDMTPARLQTIKDCQVKIKTVLAGVVADSEGNTSQLRDILRTEGTLHADAYYACHRIVKTDPGHDNLLAAAKEAANDKSGYEDGHRVCEQKTTTLGKLYAEAREVLPRFKAHMQGFVDSFPGGAVTLHVSPLKHLYRCIEKACLKGGGNVNRAETVCDIVRCIVECEDCTLMTKVLQGIIGCKGVKVVRVKDRSNHITSMKWMDIMVNFELVDDTNEHVNEVQIVHKKMLVARKTLGGHKPYAQLRAAIEIIKKLGEDPSDGEGLVELKKQLDQHSRDKKFDSSAVIQRRIEQIMELQKQLDAMHYDLADAKATPMDHEQCISLEKSIKALQEAMVDAEAAPKAAAAARSAAQAAATPISETRWHDRLSNCEICLKSFGKISRHKHFCHVCGKAVCNKCAPTKIKLRALPDEHRVCPGCQTTIEEKKTDFKQKSEAMISHRTGMPGKTGDLPGDGEDERQESSSPLAATFNRLVAGEWCKRYCELSRHGGVLSIFVHKGDAEPESQVKFADAFVDVVGEPTSTELGSVSAAAAVDALARDQDQASTGHRRRASSYLMPLEKGATVRQRAPSAAPPPPPHPHTLLLRCAGPIGTGDEKESASRDVALAMETPKEKDLWVKEVKKQAGRFPERLAQDGTGSCPWYHVAHDEPDFEPTIELCDASLQLLRLLGDKMGEDAPVGLISIFGSARGGKSTLLNQMVGGCESIFDVSHQAQSCTIGVEISAKFVPVESFVSDVEYIGSGEKSGVQVGFVDVEGQGGGGGPEYDLMIVTPAMLMSQVMIFNWTGALQPDQMLNMLGALAAVTESIVLSSQAEEEEEDGGGDTFGNEGKPILGDMHIVIRDWMHESDAEAQSLMTRESVSSARSPKRAKLRNTIRQTLNRTFKSIKIWTFPPPVDNIHTTLISDATLTVGFRKRIEELRACVGKQLQEGVLVWLEGKTLTCAHLADMMPGVKEQVNKADGILPLGLYEQAEVRKAARSKERVLEKKLEDALRRARASSQAKELKLEDLRDHVKELKKTTSANELQVSMLRAESAHEVSALKEQLARKQAELDHLNQDVVKEAEKRKLVEGKKRKLDREMRQRAMSRNVIMAAAEVGKSSHRQYVKSPSKHERLSEDGEESAKTLSEIRADDLAKEAKGGPLETEVKKLARRRSIARFEVAQQKVKKMGVLTKRGGIFRTQWQPRFFVLTENEFFFYRTKEAFDAKSVDPKHGLHHELLSDVAADGVSCKSISGGSEITVMVEKPHTFRAVSAKDGEEWVRALKEVCKFERDVVVARKHVDERDELRTRRTASLSDKVEGGGAAQSTPIIEDGADETKD